MPDSMTMVEMEKHFPSEWVLIDQPEFDQFDQIVGGKVVFHGKDRDEAWQEALTLPIPRRATVVFTGELFDPDMDYLLNI